MIRFRLTVDFAGDTVADANAALAAALTELQHQGSTAGEGHVETETGKAPYEYVMRQV